MSPVFLLHAAKTIDAQVLYASTVRPSTSLPSSLL